MLSWVRRNSQKTCIIMVSFPATPFTFPCADILCMCAVLLDLDTRQTCSSLPRSAALSQCRLRVQSHQASLSVGLETCVEARTLVF
jgi:hypothetical protein